MFHLPRIYIDAISFLLGLVAAILLGLIALGVRRLTRISRESRKQNADQDKGKKLINIDEKYFSTLFIFAQHQHLAENLFPLEDILVKPRFLLPPPALDPIVTPLIERATDRIIPFNPYLPEIISQYSIRKYPLEELLQNNVSIAIVGQPGSGKTTSLVSLLLNLIKDHKSNPDAQTKIPVFLHINDFPYQLFNPENPFEVISSAFSELFKSEQKQGVKEYLSIHLNKSSLILLLDGLDELSPTELDSAQIFIRDLMKKYPRLILITTINPENSARLFNLKFRLAFIASWDKQDSNKFICLWKKVWNIQNTSKEVNLKLEPISAEILEKFAEDNYSIRSPLEWTLFVWGIFCNDLENHDSQSLVKSHINRINKYTGLPTDISKTCFSLIENGKSLLEQSSPSNDFLIRKTLSGKFRFIQPSFIGCLAQNTKNVTLGDLNEARFNWTYSLEWLKFSISDPLIKDLYSNYKVGLDHPIYFRLQQICRLIAKPSIQAESRAPFLLEMYRILQNEEMPLGLRFGILTGYILIGDRTIQNLVKQLISSRSPICRQMALLVLPFIEELTADQILSQSMVDEFVDVKGAGLFSMSLDGKASSLQHIVDTLLSGNENMKRIAAEALAMIPGEGHDVLKETCKIDDLATRKATIAGISIIREKWTDELLAQISIEDNQWIVRDTAVQAIELRTQPDPYIPRRLPIAADASWLIQIASSKGEGISRSELPYDILLETLKNGGLEEQLASLDYLIDLSRKNVNVGVKEKFTGIENLVREKAFYLFWLFSQRQIII